jgi:hypothetical protein
LNSFTSSSSNNSLVAQAIRASATRRDPSHSLAFAANSSLAQHDHHHRSKVLLSFFFYKKKILQLYNISS